MKTYSLSSVILSVLLSSATFALVSCGNSEGKNTDKNTDENIKEVKAETSSSSIQIVRQSDLKIETVQNNSITKYGFISGRVVPKNSTQLFAEVQGRILNGNKPFKAGTSFRKGEVLLRIDSQEFGLQLDAQRSSFLNILTGMMANMKADYPTNYQSWLSYISSYEIGKSLPTLPETKSDSEKYYVTSNQVYTTYYTIKALESRLSKYTITAPFDGTISMANVDKGGLVSPAQLLGSFISDREYEIAAEVALELENEIKIGRKIQFKSKELGKTFDATIVRSTNLIDPTTQSIPVFLEVKGENLKSGLYLEGQINTSSYPNSYTIHKELLMRDGNVYILKDSIISKKEVTILGTDRDSLIVSGLAENDKLLLNRFQTPVSGLKITN